MKVELIGANTPKGKILRNRLIEVSTILDDKITINLINDKDEKNLPLLYINNNLISKGKIISKRDLLKYLKNNYKE